MIEHKSDGTGAGNNHCQQHRYRACEWLQRACHLGATGLATANRCKHNFNSTASLRSSAGPRTQRGQRLPPNPVKFSKVQQDHVETRRSSDKTSSLSHQGLSRRISGSSGVWGRSSRSSSFSELGPDSVAQESIAVVGSRIDQPTRTQSCSKAAPMTGTSGRDVNQSR